MQYQVQAFLCSVQIRNFHVWTLVFQCTVTSAVYLIMLEELLVLILEEESPTDMILQQDGRPPFSFHV